MSCKPVGLVINLSLSHLDFLNVIREYCDVCLLEHGNLRHLEEKSSVTEKFLPWQDLKSFKSKQLIQMDWKRFDFREWHSLQPSFPEPDNAPVGAGSAWSLCLVQLLKWTRDDVQAQGLRRAGGHGVALQLWAATVTALVMVFLAHRSNCKGYKGWLC